MDSSPKRVTRARAAAKGTEPAVRTTRIMTAAAKAKATPAAAAPTRSTAVKRKARADDSDDEQEAADTTTRTTTRGRLRSTSTATEEPAPRTIRGRPAKKQATEASRAQASSTTAASTRTSTARATTMARAAATRPAARRTTAESQPTRRTTAAATTTRARSSATAPTASSAAAAKPPVRKTVKFQDTGKENVAPGAKKEPATTTRTNTTIRGRPNRRGGSATATATRTTRRATPQATSKPEDKTEKKPLSPKKVTQVPVQRNDSENEPVEEEEEEEPAETIKPMMKSPVRPPSSSAKTPSSSKAMEPELDDDATTTVNNAILNPPDLGTIAFGSPPRRLPGSAIKDTMRSPARKIGAIPFPGSALKSSAKPIGGADLTSPSKSSLLHSAAKRPPSPIKALAFPASPSKHQQTPSSAAKKSMLHSPAKRAMPGLKPLFELQKENAEELVASPQMKPLAASTPSVGAAKTPSERLLMDDEPRSFQDDSEDADDADDADDDDEPFKEPMEKIKFPGRLSAVLPREIDPSPVEADAVEPEPVTEDAPPAAEDQPDEEMAVDVEDHAEEAEPYDEANTSLDEMDLVPVAEEADSSASTLHDFQGESHVDTGAVAPADPEPTPEPVQQPQDPMFQLRQKDLDPCHDMDSDAGSETASPAKNRTDTPTRAFSHSNGRRSTIGFTSLAEQFGSWSAGSPLKQSMVVSPAPSDAQPAAESAEEDPNQGHFFDEEMQSRVEVPDDEAEQPSHEAHDESASSEEMAWTAEDVDFAQEAEEMAHENPEPAEKSFHSQPHDDSLSDASQEYGDENEAPAMEAAAPVTPERPHRIPAFPHTTTKVPLKPADNSTPSPLKKQSMSASRASSRRMSLKVPRGAIGSSLSPSKKRRSPSKSPRKVSMPSDPSTPTPKTPGRDDESFSTADTPATPGFTRPDLDHNLLRGAVVFVEARTSDGGDASGLFTDLLKQMGAKCRKTWNWSPRNSSAGDVTADKIGITHVVYKDGRSQTLEKVRRSGGLVQCVGVSWVLE